MNAEEMQEERNYLKTTCEILDERMKKMGEHIFESEEKAEDFSRYIWENKADMDAQELNSVRTESEMDAKMMLRERDYFKKLIKIKDSPYFASIVFQEDGDIKRDIYIGMTYLKKDEFNNVIYDWRAPISSLFYDYETGKAEYMAPEGVIKGNLQRKRQYKIEKRKLVRVFDNSLNINDEMLQEVLAENSNEKMKNIVNTIQQEQNQVIRNTKDKNLIVQGIAGSGKTSVALHRIAFLLYKIPNLTSEKILIFSPNQIFTEYISNVLPELGEENTVQTTFHDYLHKIISEYKNVETFIHFLARYYQDGDVDKGLVIYKQSKEIIKDMEDYVDDLIKNTKFKTGFVENKVFEYQPKELNQMFHERYSNLTFFERIKEMAIKLSESNYRGKSGKKNTYQKLILEALGIKKDFKYFLRDFYKSKFFKYEIKESEINKLKNNKEINYEDALLLVYLKGLMEGFYYDRYMEQVVIDEAQDYNFLQYKIISKIFKRANFTILGDINQNINPYYHYDSLDELNELWKSRYIELSKTYRSSEEIIEYTNKILGLKHISAIRKEVHQPVLIHKQSDLETDINLLKEKYKNTAIVTKDEVTALRVYDRLKNKFKISYVDANSEEFSKELLVIPAYLAKGLEFDSVIVYQDDKSKYDMDEKNLLYVACTRAQHELIVFE